MKDILQNWLEGTLGIILDIDGITQVLKDGTIFIKIFKHYGAINVNSVRKVFPTEDDEICLKNLNRLKIWFQLINIDFSDDFISAIIDGNYSQCINVLYQLYLTFERKSHLPFVSKQKERCLIMEQKGKFKVSKASLSSLDPEQHHSNIYNFSSKLHEHKNLLDWYEDKYEKGRKKWVCPKIKRPVSKQTHVIEDISLNDGSIKTSLQTSALKQNYSESRKLRRRKEDIYYVRHELSQCGKLDKVESFGAGYVPQDCRQRKVTGKFVTSNPDATLFDSCGQNNFLPPISSKPISQHHLPEHVKLYMKKLKSSVGFSCKRQNLNTFGSCAVNSIWDIIVNNEKSNLKSIMASRLLKQSMYEKEVASKFFSLLKQHQVQKKSYINLEHNIMKSRKSVVSLNTSLLDEHVEEKGEYFNRDWSEYDDISDEDVTENDNDVESSYFNSDRQRFIFDDFKAYYQNEKKRTVELHRKLYAEKLKLRFERHYAICLQTVVDIIDLAARLSEFRSEYELEVPPSIWSDWKCLFHNEQPIFDVVEDLELLLFPVLTNFDVLTELTRQDVLNENHLDMYLQVRDDWEFNRDNGVDEGLEPKPKVPKYTVDHESQIPLGYIVHKLLETKYPLPPQPLPADLPKFPIMAVLNGIENVDAIYNLRNLLQKADVLVVDISTAVNFCLQCYKNELSTEFVRISHEVENEISSYTTIGDDEILEDEEKCKIQDTQTGSSLFAINNPHPMADLALLGCDLFNMILLGSELPINILFDVIVHYIKHNQDSIKGWVLVNFPSTLYQASIAEHGLTGKKFPFHLEDDLTSSSGSECKISQIGKEVFQENNSPAFDVEVKNSRIVPNPRKLSISDAFKTYFTMYVTLVKGDPISYNTINDYEVNEWDDVHSESTLLLEQPEKEGVPTMHNFYQDQGIGYDFIYEQFDLNALKQLTRVILLNYLEDGKIPMPEDLFSEELLHEFEPSIHIKWFGPPHSYSFEEAGVCRSTKPQSISVPVLEDVEDIDEELTVGESKAEEIEWDFVDFPILDNAVVTLAAFWESVESVYLNNLKHAFFVKRKTDDTCIPYITYITKQINLYIAREDDRQKIVSEFLEAYNGIHQVLRSDIDLKCELHLRVVELQQTLTELCTNKCIESQIIRRLLINQNWTYQEIALYTNSYISLFQLEIDRCLRTLEFLQDYYLAMLGIYAAEPLPSVTISKIDIYMGEEVEIEDDFNEMETEGEGELEEEEEEVIEYENVRTRMRISINLNPDEINDELYKSVIDRMWNYEELKEIAPPSCDIINTKADEAFEQVLKVKAQIDNIIIKEESAALKRHHEYVSNKQSQSAKKESPKNLKKAQKGKPAVESPSDVPSQQTSDAGEQEDFEAKELNLKKLFEEWRFALKSEMDRLSFRTELIKRKSRFEFLDIEEVMGNKFAEFDILINNRLLGEISCIEKLCHLFQVAIEEKTPIKAQLVFSQDHFYIIRNVVAKPELPIKLPVALEETLQDESFTIRQLEMMMERLIIIAPNGIITREAFIKFIQSVIRDSSSQNNMKLVPAVWSKLKHNDLEMLFQKIFGNYSIIEWRDFLICCLELPTPVTEDIIDARLQFSRYDLLDRELIPYDSYIKTTLWFQRELPENPFMALRNILAKEFLFTLFTSSEKILFNYMSFLLAFCRDADAKVGFGKGLSLLCGRCVIVYEEDLYLEEMLSDHINTEYKIAVEILNEIVHDVVCNSMTGINESISDIIKDGNYGNHDAGALSGDDMANLVLTEGMYQQVFRKFSILRWTSKVPNTVITTMLCFTYYSMYVPEYVFLYPDIFSGMHNFMLKYTDEDVFVPELVNHWWMEVIFDQVRKFTAYSLSNVVKEIIDGNGP